MDFKRFIFGVIIFVTIDLAFTTIAVQSASPNDAIGSLRPIGSITPKVAQLLTVGAAVAFVPILVLRKVSPELALSALVFTPLLDADHLPVMLGIPQPIRPAHSFVFMVVVASAIYLFIRRLDIALVAVSATMMHLAADSPSFPLISPLSVELYKLGTLEHSALLGGSILIAVTSGYVARKKRDQIQDSPELSAMSSSPK